MRASSSAYENKANQSLTWAAESEDPAWAHYNVQVAQVYATLALAAATEEGSTND